MLLWASLPPWLRRRTRPVAGADYWNKSALRRFIGGRVFRAVLIDRERKEGAPDPVEQMVAALAGGDSLIIFPEGTRNTTDAVLLPFKSGLFHLAMQYPRAELVPVWINNLARVMPKGQLVPIPLLCTVTFGTAAGAHRRRGQGRVPRSARAMRCSRCVPRHVRRRRPDATRACPSDLPESRPD